MSSAKYYFTPWLRKGIGNAIIDEDTFIKNGTSSVSKERPQIELKVFINGSPSAKKEFQIIGPADIIGFSRDLVIRTNPVNWNTNFPPNYLAHIEFYDEDFPWRYS